MKIPENHKILYSDYLFTRYKLDDIEDDTLRIWFTISGLMDYFDGIPDSIANKIYKNLYTDGKKKKPIQKKLILYSHFMKSDYLQEFMSYVQEHGICYYLIMFLIENKDDNSFYVLIDKKNNNL